MFDPATTPDSGLAVRLRGVTKTYSTATLALGPVDIDIARGEFVSFLGPSGCGKSTALRIIAGLAQPSAGKVELTRGARIGFVFQEPTLMPWANVRDNVRLPLKLARVNDSLSRDRADAALAQVGLADFAQAYPRTLSGGMRMRVSLARALITHPDILLLDEPFAALDEISRFKLNDDLLTLWRGLGKTIIFVTHSVFESVYLSQRVIVMTPRPGQVSAEITLDTPRDRDKDFRTSSAYVAQCRRVSQALARTGAMDAMP